MGNQDTAIRTRRRGIVQVVPTISTGIYTPGDQFGGIDTLQFIVPTLEQDQSVIDSIVVIDKDNERSHLDIFFYDTDPSATISSSDNVLFAMTDAGSDLVISTARVFPSCYIPAGLSSGAVQAIAQVTLSKPIKAKADVRDIYMAVIIRTASTYTASSDIRYKLHIDQGK